MKTEKLQKINDLFVKHRILQMSDICTSFEDTSMRTIIRYLNEIGYYSSYNHAGMYYTITGIPEFDDYGFWGYKEALFSIYGNLKETIIAQIDNSEAGMTNNELAVLLRVNTRSTLTAMAARGVISRSKGHGVYIYYSVDLDHREQQKSRRAALDEATVHNAEFDPYDIVDVLTAYIRGVRTPEQVTAHLRYKRHSISSSIVAAIFERYGLEHDIDGKKNTI